MLSISLITLAGIALFLLFVAFVAFVCLPTCDRIKKWISKHASEENAEVFAGLLFAGGVLFFAVAATIIIVALHQSLPL